MRWTIGPPITAPAASGTVVANAVSPVPAALHVVSSTDHGSATTDHVAQVADRVGRDHRR
jgi:hypothetical protein